MWKESIWGLYRILPARFRLFACVFIWFCLCVGASAELHMTFFSGRSFEPSEVQYGQNRGGDSSI